MITFYKSMVANNDFITTMQAYLIVNVAVLDINDPPDFGSATIEIPTSEVREKQLNITESNAVQYLQLTMIGSIIRRVTAVDHDLSLNGVVSYALEPASQNTFSLNTFTGDLILQQTLDLQTTYQITITATVRIDLILIPYLTWLVAIFIGFR